MSLSPSPQVTTVPRGVRVASVDDVPPGWVLTVRVGARQLALVNDDGTFYALDGSCSHAGGPLAPNRLRAGCVVECPWHNSTFDARTGAVVEGPARKPQQTYPVAVHDGAVYVEA